MDPKEYGAMIHKYAAFGAVATAISMAKDVGILDILYNTEESLTSQQISDKGGLKERYVRELMGALVTAGVVQVDESSTKFYIIPELRPVLKATAMHAHFPVYFGQKYKAIMNCYSKDGPAGVRYEEYPAVFDILDERSEESQDRLIDEDILPSHQMFEDKLKSGIDAFEIGSSKGTLILNLCQRFPNSRFTGSDVAESVLDIARARTQVRGITNCQFIILDACNIPESFDQQYDWIFCCDTIHDLPKPEKAIMEFYRLLKPGGIFTMVDYVLDGSLRENIGNTRASFYFTAGTFLCIPDSFQGGQSAALGPCWAVETAREMISKAGFKLMEENRSARNPHEVIFVCHKPE